MATLSDLKARLTDQQAKAAHLLTINEFDGKPKTQDEIAEEVGVTRQQLYRWRYEDRDFIAYQAAISDTFLESYRAEADAKLMHLIVQGPSNNGIPSIKALQLYYELLGRKVERKHITTNEQTTSPQLTQAEIQAGLKELGDLLDK